MPSRELFASACEGFRGQVSSSSSGSVPHVRLPEACSPWCTYQQLTQGSRRGGNALRSTNHTQAAKQIFIHVESPFLPQIFILLQSYRPEHVLPFGLEWIQLAVNNRVVAFLEHLTIFLLSTLERSGSKLFFPDGEHRRPRGWCRHRGCFYRNRETANLKLPKQLHGHYFQLAS